MNNTEVRALGLDWHTPIFPHPDHVYNTEVLGPVINLHKIVLSLELDENAMLMRKTAVAKTRAYK